MLSKEILDAHYVEYGNQPDAWVANMEITKYSIVKQIFDHVDFKTDKQKLKVIVLGVSDKRYIPIHEKIFAEILKREIDMTTFDVDTKHLGTNDRVIQHDVTTPFPNAPHDIVFSHALMKFLTQEEQLATIMNSYAALAEGGVAMHIMHPPELEGTSELRPWQYRVDLNVLEHKLIDQQIKPMILRIKSESQVDWLRDTTVLLLQRST